MTPARPMQSGFTLIELIIVIVITGVIATVVAPILSGPFTAYTDSSRRAILVQQAHSVVQRIQQDLSYAVPGSVSVSSNTITWRPLTRDPDPSRQPALRYPSGLDVASEQGNIPVLGCANADTEEDQTVILGSLSGSAPVLSIDNADCDASPPQPATLELDGSDFVFDADGIGSPFHRLYLSGDEMTLSCDGTNLTRFLTGQESQSRLLAQNLDSCNLELSPGSTQNAPTLLIDITLEDSDGEQVRLVRLLHLENAL